MKRSSLPVFANKNELLSFLKKDPSNKSLLLAKKRMTLKHADGIPFIPQVYDPAIGRDIALKAGAMPGVLLQKDSISAKLAINTTNIFDSHADVHFPGLWTKSLKETGHFLMLLKTHKGDFEFIIADGDDLKAYTEMMSWKDLGFKFKGETEVLVFEAEIRKQRNPYMFEQYAMKRVKNHSAGMGYVKIALAVDDDSAMWQNEYVVWEKYIDQIVNKDVVADRGYFYAVTEAKVFEGSAVPRGSNYATPTIEVKNAEPEKSTQEEEPQEPALSTPANLDYLVKNLFN